MICYEGAGQWDIREDSGLRGIGQRAAREQIDVMREQDSELRGAD